MSAVERTYRIRLYAILREHAGRGELTVTSRAQTAGDLFNELKQQFQWTWPRESFRAAVNDTFCDWEQTLRENDEVSFIPPVSGG